MSKKYDILTPLDICTDIILSGKTVVPEFGQKEKNVDYYYIEMGGSTCIFACQAAKLGLKTTGVGIAGEDIMGDIVIDNLKKSGVCIKHIKRDNTKKTSISVHLNKGDDRAILTYPGTINIDGLSDMMMPLIEKTRHMHIGSFYLMEKLIPEYPRLIAYAKKNGVTISLDTNWDPKETWQNGLMEILSDIDILFPNTSEVIGIAGKKNAEEAASALSQIVGLMVLKKGSDGADVYQKGARIAQEKPMKVELIDAVGAGDSFDAGYLYGYLNGFSAERCLKAANICGAWNTQNIGGTKGQIWHKAFMKALNDTE